MKRPVQFLFNSFILSLIAMLLINSICLAQTSLAEKSINNISFAEAFIRNYLDVVQSGDRNKIQLFINANYDHVFLNRLPGYYHVTLQMANYYSAGGEGYKFNGIVNSDGNELKAVITNNLTSANIELRIPVAEKSTFRINGFIEFKPLSSQEDEKENKKFSDNEIIEKLEKCLDLMIKADDFSGTIILAKDGIPLFQKAYGLANKSYLIPNKLNTKFNIASVGKIFTGIAIAQLVERGKLSFTDTVNKFISAEWLKPEVSSKIQIQHLLTHTSGLGDYFTKLYSQSDKFYFNIKNHVLRAW